MLSAKDSRKFDKVETDEEGLSIACSEVDVRTKNAGSRISDDTKNAREMHKKHHGPGCEHNTNSFEVAALHLF